MAAGAGRSPGAPEDRTSAAEGWPATAFIDPWGRNRPAIESWARQLLDRVLDRLAGAAEGTALPAAARADRGLGEWWEMPRDGVSEPDLTADLERLLAASMNPSHPGWIGHMDPQPTTASMLADLAAAAINNNLLSREMSPALSRLEVALLARFASLFGLPDGAGGVLCSGGSVANLHALAVARNHHLGCLDEGLWGGAAAGRVSGRPVILASAEAHTSICKAAMVLGLGTGAVLAVATRDDRMCPDDLRAQLRASRERGESPFCVVATAGTTTAGSIDPLDEIAALAEAEGLWLHVDAAYGGGVVLSARHRDRLRGIHRASSITFNPQKWLYVAKTCAMVLFRDLGAMAEDFSIPLPYAATADPAERNFGEISVQGTRHADVLKLWLSLRHIGLRGYEALIDASYGWTESFVSEIATRPFLRLAVAPDTNVVCFRGEPAGRAPEEWDAWNARLQAELLTERGIFLSLPHYRRGRWLRAVLLNPYSQESTVGELFAHIDRFHEREAGPRATPSGQR